MKMKFILAATSFAATMLASCSMLEEPSHSSANSAPLYSAGDIWTFLKETPYPLSSFPLTEVTMESFFNFGVDRLLQSANRTLESEADILPYFNKLLHPNGICLRGTWEINGSSSYSGFFKKGAKGLIIARASTTLSNTKSGSLRGFGLAGKIFPTLDPEKKIKTANFFMIDNLGGTYAQNYTEVSLTNEPNIFPTVSFAVLNLIRIAQATQKAFSAADVNPGIRQLYPISYLNLADEAPKTPVWMKIQGDESEIKSAEEDFRHELRDHIALNGKLTFGIFVADKTDLLGNKKWVRLGNLSFSDSVASEGCDHQLHFHHNKFKKDTK